MPAELNITPFSERPELLAHVADLEAESFPKFIEEDRVWADVSPHFYDEFSAFQFFVIDSSNEQLAAVCNTVPFGWNGDPAQLPGYHQMLISALADWRSGKKPNTLSGVQVIVHQNYRGHDVPGLVFTEIAELADQHGLSSVMSAVRPTLKDRYPLTPIEEYAHWRRADGQLFDPWLRAQELMGSTMIQPVAESTVIEAQISDWEEWTGMQFPASGEYWLPEGLSTLTIDLESDVGRHCEPHVWFKHKDKSS